MPQRFKLSIPKSGSSRFSKALPTIPGMLDKDEVNDDRDSAPLSSPLKDLPPPPPAPPLKNNALGKLPPRTSSLSTSTSNSITSPVYNYENEFSAKTTIARRPLDSALSPTSPLSETSSVNTLPSGRPTMSIPRKPVANLQPPVLSPLYLGQPSPTDTLASLVSAYARDPDDDLGKSSYETTPASSNGFEERASQDGDRPIATVRGKWASSTLPSSVKMSSGSLPPRPNAGSAASRTSGASASSGAPQRQLPPVKENPPLPPSKDDDDDLSPNPPSSNTDLAAPSSPRPEIWKRRPHMSQNSRELPVLKLDFSHGSTADTQPASDLTTASQAAPKPTKPASQRVPPLAGGLPGRNVRPNLSSKNQAPASQTMGNETSKLRQIRDKLGSSQRSGSISSTSSSKAGLPSRPAAQRPPTPEYQNEDIKESAVEPFAHPVSPASSTGDAPRSVSPDFSKELPPQPPKDEPKADVKASQKVMPRKALPSTPARDLPATTVPPQPQPRTEISAPPNAPTPSIKGNTVSARGPSPTNESASILSRVSEDRPVVQPQSSTPVVNPQKPMQPTRPPQATNDPRLLQSDTQGLLYRGRDGTLYPEMKVDREPHPKAANFPLQKPQSSSKDSVTKAKPLNGSHYNCFQKHRLMQRRGNRNCPLTCQTCDRADLEDRWACTFCNLRICDPCFRKFNTCQRDLDSLVDALNGNAPFNLAPQSQFGAALGLQSIQ